jgi:hypothetical protein
VVTPAAGIDELPQPATCSSLDEVSLHVAQQWNLYP